MSETPSDAWTTKRLLDWITAALSERGMDSPRHMADLLLCHVLGCKRLVLYTNADRPASAEERERLRGLVRRALSHEPIEYLVGERPFFGMMFSVDRRVLIPRPSTEALVEEAIRSLRAVAPPPVVRRRVSRAAMADDEAAGGADRTPASPAHADGVAPVAAQEPPVRVLVADVCTGSGCIAAAVARHVPSASVVACDISPGAIEVAGANVRKHEVADRVELRLGDLLEPLADMRGALHALLSNPPYIPDHEWADVAPNVRLHEPTLALRGGADGLDLVRTLIADGPELLRSGGVLMIEVAASHADRAAALARDHRLLTDVRVIADHEGLPRVVFARRS